MEQHNAMEIMYKHADNMIQMFAGNGTIQNIVKADAVQEFANYHQLIHAWIAMDQMHSIHSVMYQV
jgi:hypothetical protein